MPPRYIAPRMCSWSSRCFGSPAALQNVLRHYAGATTLDITSAKLAVCKDGYNALVYGRPVSGELAWLLMQARSRTPSQEERALLDPFMQLLTTRKPSARRKIITNKCTFCGHTDPERGYVPCGKHPTTRSLPR